MAEHEKPTGAHGTARFHFDVAYDPANAPTLKAFIEWLRHGMEGDRSGGLPGAVFQYHKLNEPIALMARVILMLPSKRRQARRRSEDACIAAAMPYIVRIHDVMREFAIDLTVGRFADTIRSMVSIAMMDRMLEEAIERMTPERRPAPNGLTTDDRIRRGWDAMRADLESEAVVGLLDGTTERTDWPRLTAALRSAREEIGETPLNARIGVLIEDIERATAR